MATKKLTTETAYENHGENSKPPSLKKGEFYAVGTFMDDGAMTTTFPRGISPNVKTGTSSGGEQ